MGSLLGAEGAAAGGRIEIDDPTEVPRWNWRLLQLLDDKVDLLCSSLRTRTFCAAFVNPRPPTTPATAHPVST